MRSDNGTNFVGQELREALQNHIQIKRTLAERQIKWIFNQSAESHCGLGAHHTDNPKDIKFCSSSTQLG